VQELGRVSSFPGFAAAAISHPVVKVKYPVMRAHVSVPRPGLLVSRPNSPRIAPTLLPQHATDSTVVGAVELGRNAECWRLIHSMTE
jgi:hypothetical protein